MFSGAARLSYGRAAMKSRRRPRRARGAHQLAVAVRATVEPGGLPDLRARLTAMDERAPGAATIPFSAFEEVHFARFLLLEDSAEPGGLPIPASLVYMSEIDAPRDAHLDRLADLGGAGLDATFGLCEGYPAAPTRPPAGRSSTRTALAAQASYVNTVGRTVEQIRAGGAAARARSRRSSTRAATSCRRDPRAVRARDPGLRRAASRRSAWARRRAPRPRAALARRARRCTCSACRCAGARLPLVLVVAAGLRAVLRLHETRDPAPHLRPDPEHVAGCSRDRGPRRPEPVQRDRLRQARAVPRAPRRVVLFG